MVSLKIGKALIPSVDLVIFDKDGTLIDVHQYWVEMSYLRARIIARQYNLDENDIRALASAMGVDTATGRIKESGPVGLKKREVVMQAAVDYLSSRGHRNSTADCTAAFEEVDRLSLTMFDNLIREIPGTKKLLRELHENGCKIALATSDRTSRAKLAMEHLDLLNDIDLIVGADAIASPKPDPETVTVILEKLRCSPGNTVVIGDTDVDMELGVRSGVKASIGVFSGTASKEALLKRTPFVIENVGLIEVNLS
jgi:phosphoglycolate phosphatase